MNLGFILICGPPGIGKSTFLREFIHSNHQDSSPYVLVSVSYDDILDRCLENVLIQNDRNEWKLSRLYIRSLINFLAEHLSKSNQLIESYESLDSHLLDRLNALSDSQNVELKRILNSKFIDNLRKIRLLESLQTTAKLVLFLIDDLFYYESMRYEYYRLAIDLEACLYYSIFLKTEDLAFLYQRNLTRSSNERLSDSVIENVFNKFEFPNKDWELQFSMVHSVVNDRIDRDSLNHALKTKQDEFKLHLAKLKETRLKQENDLQEKELNKSLKNLFHECDLCLRKLIGDHLKTSDASKRAECARELNMRKASLLSQLKQEEHLENSLTRRLSILFDSKQLDLFEKHLKEKLFENSSLN